jgi:hypothetical protein
VKWLLCLGDERGDEREGCEFPVWAKEKFVARLTFSLSESKAAVTSQQHAMPQNYHVGQRLSFESALCTVRYIGSVEGTQKEWLGVEWDDPSRGRHDGEHKGKRYFTCKCLVHFKSSV